MTADGKGFSSLFLSYSEEPGLFLSSACASSVQRPAVVAEKSKVVAAATGAISFIVSLKITFLNMAFDRLSLKMVQMDNLHILGVFHLRREGPHGYHGGHYLSQSLIPIQRCVTPGMKSYHLDLYHPRKRQVRQLKHCSDKLEHCRERFESHLVSLIWLSPV